uniref:Piezo-type mechanosensitive ion channel component n=1 Tax=Macrostomum lignano TaxID=282301 RepID=A0A1I8F9L4_9PLAT
HSPTSHSTPRPQLSPLSFTLYSHSPSPLLQLSFTLYSPISLTLYLVSCTTLLSFTVYPDTQSRSGVRGAHADIRRSADLLLLRVLLHAVDFPVREAAGRQPRHPRAALELYHLRGHSLHRRRRKTMETLIIEVMSKYSLIICCTFWVLMCSRSVVNISHIIVMAIFLYFIITFRLFYGFWRRQLIVCFWGIMLYSMLTLLLLIYAYQFQSVPEFITRLTGIQPATLKEIGIEKYETPQLFLNLLFPTSFIIVIMIHVKNFHKTFLQLSNMQPDLDPSATEQPIQQLQPAPPSSIERPIEVDVEMTAAAGRESEIEDDFEDPATAASGGGAAGKRAGGAFNSKTAALRR